jgi:hypothetical protein
MGPPTCRVCRGGCGDRPTIAAGGAAAEGVTFSTAIPGPFPLLNYSIHFPFEKIVARG